MKKTCLQELDEQYPIKTKQKPSRRARAAARYRDSKLGKMGAASGVRVIDPATVDLSKYGISKAVEDSMIPWSE